MFRFILGIAFGILALIFVFQNMENTNVTFLAWTITTSRAVILFIILAAGFIVGWAVGSIGRWKRRAKR
ncbi:MAG: LapA family protein [Spirochaetaceae bacterium]|nr:MAG: LapA family protein [Spirochaetaceae bacterium]